MMHGTTNIKLIYYSCFIQFYVMFYNMFYGIFVKGTNLRKHASYLCVFFLKFWTLYRSDDGLDDGPDVVN